MKDSHSQSIKIFKQIAFIAYVSYLYGPIQIFAGSYLRYQKILSACRRISDIFIKLTEEENPRRIHIFDKINGDITINNVSHDYRDGEIVLSHVSFKIKNGEKVALIGKSGSGKTTIMNLISGLYMPKEGEIYIDNVEIRNIKLESLRERIGIVSQNIFLFNDSIINNIKYSNASATINDVIDAAKISRAHDFIVGFPDGYNTNAGELGKKLSGGERQRISIARCILKKPDIIMFDEPTAHMDFVTAESLIDSIKNTFKKKTCLIITHSLKYIDWIDRIIVIDNGRIIQEGNYNDLIRKNEFYKKYLNIHG